MLPKPTADGRYVFPDGSVIRPSRNFPGKWFADDAQGRSLTDDPNNPQRPPRMFGSAMLAYVALERDRRAPHKPGPFATFCATVERNGWTPAQLRCDTPPSAELLDFIDAIGNDYESCVDLWLKMQSQATA